MDSEIFDRHTYHQPAPDDSPEMLPSSRLLQIPAGDTISPGPQTQPAPTTENQVVEELRVQLARHTFEDVRRHIKSHINSERNQNGQSWRLADAEIKFGLEVPMGLAKAVATVGRKIEEVKAIPLNKRIAKRWKNNDFSVLDQMVGIRVSSCSGVAQRALLSQVLLSCLPLGIHTYDGGSLSSLESKVRTFLLAQRTEIPSAWASFEKSEKESTKTLISYLLKNLLPTGLDESKGTITLWWPNKSDSQSTISLPLSKSGWLGMRQDGATFACSPTTAWRLASTAARTIS
ncbi:hypothetical protein TWF696_004722 [Orbilia brochopaga]|uniref:Uncharacterized protein n=1 Tax=Orbilia brochopaga TaxID=3140254 RepID=A0AAV9V1T6_9PEZI